MEIQTYIKAVGKLHEQVGWSLEETENGLMMFAMQGPGKIVITFEVDKNCLEDLKEKMEFECVLIRKIVEMGDKGKVHDEYIVVFWENDCTFNVTFKLEETGCHFEVNEVVRKGYNKPVIVNEMPFTKEKVEKIQSYLIEKVKKDPMYRMLFVFLTEKEERGIK